MFFDGWKSFLLPLHVVIKVTFLDYSSPKFCCLLDDWMVCDRGVQTYLTSSQFFSFCAWPFHWISKITKYFNRTVFFSVNFLNFLACLLLVQRRRFNLPSQVVVFFKLWILRKLYVPNELRLGRMSLDIACLKSSQNFSMTRKKIKL